MRIVFAGTPEFAVPSLRSLAAAGHDVVGVITREDAPLGRKRILTPSPVAAVAAELGIPTLRSNRLDAQATEWVRELAAELGVIVAFGGLVREPLLHLPRHGWINLHFSELPRWRGAAPVQRALMAGEQRLGVTVFRLVEELDAGDVLSRDAREFPPGTTAGAALAELAEYGTGALGSAIRLLGADPSAGEPQRGPASYAHKLTRQDGRLELGLPRAEVLAQWAGVTPEPGAFAMHGEESVKLLDIGLPNGVPTEDRQGPDPTAGVGVVRLDRGRALLGLVDGELELARVQSAGRPAMDGAAWLRGRTANGQAVVLS